MNIKGYKVPQWLIEKYLRSCKYNESCGTQESDQSQKDAHNEIMEYVRIKYGDLDYSDFSFIIIQLVNDLLIKGY